MIEIINQVSNEAVLVWAVLNERSQNTAKLNIDHDYLSRNANVGADSIARCLFELVDKNIITTDGKVYFLNQCQIKIAPQKREDKTIANLELEVASLQKQLAAQENHNLSAVLKGDERTLVLQMEEYMGRSLIAGEIFFLGILISQYGPTRVTKAYQQVRDQRFPVRAMFAVLNNKKYGVGKDQKPENKTNYGTIENTRDL